MVDVVVNHNGYDGASTAVDYTDFSPFNVKSYYHPYCVPDYSNITSTQQCWQGDTTVSLPDLRTEDSDVALEYQDWIKELVANYSIDGLRLDTVLEVDTGFWSEFSKAASVFITGEVDSPSTPTVCSYQNYLDSILNYPLYFTATAAFNSTSGSMSALVSSVNAVKSNCSDSTLLGSFTENHDQPRFAQQTGDMSLAKNIITFTIMQDGIPIIYQGQEQHYASLGGVGNPFNREALWPSGYNKSAPLYEHIVTLNAIRKQAIAKDNTYLTTKNSVVYNEANVIAMKKGSIVTVLTNAGANAGSSTVTLADSATGYSANEQIMNVLRCTTLTVASGGDLVVPMSTGRPLVLFPLATLNGSGICGQ